MSAKSFKASLRQEGTIDYVKMNNNGFRATYSLAYLAPIFSFKFQNLFEKKFTKFVRNPNQIVIAVHIRYFYSYR